MAAIVGFTVAGSAWSAAAAGPPAGSAGADDTLQEVVVTGSLIPQIKTEQSTPVLSISAEDIQVKGFSDVADALQHASFATGSVQGGGYSGGFTQGAKTISLFGLDPSYTKFLIDGRPMADYPALYNGSVNFVSIDGIPLILVDHIDILPGAQSSLYGSDAIAGVVNVVMKKTMDGPMVDARYGWTTGGGGVDRRFAIADGFSWGNLNVVVGGQYENTSPIWGYKRSLTSGYFGGGPGGAVAARNWLVSGLFGDADGNLYYQEDPANCANVANQFNGTTGLRTRAGRGQYCGTFSSGDYTIQNGTEETQGYLHLSYDVNEHAKIFSDVLVAHDIATFSTGGGFLGTSSDSASQYYYYEDPRIPGDFLNLQQIYSPEEIGGLDNTNNRNTTNSIRATVGVTGDILAGWQYTADFTYTENKLTERTHLAFETAINDFYSQIMGPSLGYDADNASYIFQPNYGLFYTPLTPAQYASFTGYATSYSKTEESLARIQLTNPKLFPLPGGDAGIALLGEGGGQGWDYAPDPRFIDGETYLYTATAGSGHRSRFAGTAELRLPVVKMVTFDLSGRYDDYKVTGGSFHAFTYNGGVEFRPIPQLLFRGRYGTAFKAPTLADEFQGPSGFFTSSATDYYACQQRGYAGPTYQDCPYANTSFQGQTEGTRDLKPIHAKVWDLGIAYSPVPQSSITLDFIRWKITDEVSQLDTDQLLKTDAACLDGTLDATSPTCVNAIANVTRDENGLITLLNTPKQNVAQENLSTIVFGLSYSIPTTYAGTFVVDGSYTNVLRHFVTRFQGDQPLDYLNNPFWSQEFKTKENIALTWDFKNFGTTFYVERYGRTPNFVSTLSTDGYADTAEGAGRLGTWTLANWSAKYQFLPGLTAEFNVTNLLNKMPPRDNTYSGIYDQPYNSLNYNVNGRAFFIQATYKMGK